MKGNVVWDAEHGWHDGPKTCEWYVLCTNPATTTRPSVIGDIPICDRCNEKMDSIEEGTR